jgi:FkbM family methyltransferase
MKNLAFDIGANVGDATEFLLRDYTSVVSFEPNPQLVEKLKARFQHTDRVTVASYAISNKDSEEVFNISSNHTISTLNDNWRLNGRFSNKFDLQSQIKVQTLTLKNIISKYGVPDYVKIDVEGHEFEVISTLDIVLPDTIFAFEWTEEGEDSIKKIIEHVSKIGYKKFTFQDGDHIMFENSDGILYNPIGYSHDLAYWQDYNSFYDIITKHIDANKYQKWGLIYFKA